MVRERETAVFRATREGVTRSMLVLARGVAKLHQASAFHTWTRVSPSVDCLIIHSLIHSLIQVVRLEYHPAATHVVVIMFSTDSLRQPFSGHNHYSISPIRCCSSSKYLPSSRSYSSSTAARRQQPSSPSPSSLPEGGWPVIGSRPSRPLPSPPVWAASARSERSPSSSCT